MQHESDSLFWKSRNGIGSHMTKDRSNRTAERSHLKRSLQARVLDRQQQRLVRQTGRQAVRAGKLTLSVTGEILELNDELARLLGLDKSSLIGRFFQEFVAPSSKRTLLRHIAECQKSGNIINDELDVANNRGGFSTIDLESVSWSSDQDDLCYILSVVGSEREREGFEQNLQSLKVKEKTAERSKRRDLASLSHELRTPLGAMIGFADLLLSQSSRTADEVDTGLKVIHRNGCKLLSLIEDLIDLAQIETGSVKMEHSDIIVVDEIRTVLAAFEERAKEKNLALHYESLTPLPPKIVTDVDRFRQILTNIVDNAVKFTDHGTVRIQLSLVPKTLEENPGSFLHIDVTDSGRGISSDQFQALFKPFSKGDEVDGYLGGSGLGLTLARRLGEGLGGGVQLLRSEIGVGSTFRITIDPNVEINAISASPGLSVDGDLLDILDSRAVVDADALKGMKVLVVEDGEDNRMIISRLLKKAGALIECVEDGEEAIEKLIGQSYDVILMDIQLPQMDGYMVTSKLRQKGLVTPIIALTAHTLIEDRVKAQRAGFDGFLTKPIEWAKLVNALAQYQHPTPQSPLH
ncbi:MAG: response regulator [Proteobacteria bacterium]|nr:MAG: response regulator [Pseudomonadota bacterium]